MHCANDTPLFDLSNNSTQHFLDALSAFQSYFVMQDVQRLLKIHACELDPQNDRRKFAVFARGLMNCSTIRRIFLKMKLSIRSAYGSAHGYICVAICTFGIITNLVHVLVLTRPTMRCSAVNCILTAVAICDMGTMGSYLIYIYHFVFSKLPSCSPIYSYLWVQFLLWHVVVSIALHTTSLWLVVAMAFIRRMTLKRASLNSAWQRPKFAWKICCAIYLITFILCIPTLLVHHIREFSQEWSPPSQCIRDYRKNYTAKQYTLDVPGSLAANGCGFFKLNLWISGIVFKVIPCALLLYFSIGIVAKLHKTRMNRKLLLNLNNTVSTKKHSKKTDRTTALLLGILTVFLITELPQGVIAILSAIYTNHVHKFIYFYLGDILDLLSLLNSSINFILYCVMSSRYRNAFWTVLLPPFLYKSCCIEKCEPLSTPKEIRMASGAVPKNNNCNFFREMSDFRDEQCLVTLEASYSTQQEQFL